MSKKRKGNKPTSARGHVEGNVIRWREKVDLIRIDRKGRPINKPIGINAFDRHWLAQQLIDTGSTILPTPPKPPDNVSKMSDHRPKPKPKAVSTAGNEAEQLPKANKQRALDYTYLNNTALAIAEFRNWSRISKEIGHTRPEVWTKDSKGRLHSDSLDEQRRRSIEGHTKPKLKFKSPPSTVHNPMISAAPIVVHNKRLRARVHSKGLSPSGTPISNFTVGQIKTIKNPVVYTNKWPFIKEVKSTELTPPTASKHWQGTPASNDGNTQHLHRTPTAKSIEHKLNSEVQWFINHVEPQNWPQHVFNFANWNSGGPIPNTGAINKAAAEYVTRYNLLNNLYQGLYNDWKMLDSALAMSNQEVSLLNQELEAERQRNKLLEYDIAMRNGEDPDTVRDSYDIIKPKTPDVPDDADVMLAQYNVYQSFVKCDGPEHAFARYVYGDSRLGEVIRDQADMRCRERQQAYDDREYWRTVAEQQTQYEREREHEYSDWWNTAYSKYLKQRARRQTNGAVRNPVSESVSLLAMAQRNKRYIYYKRDSIYYSAPNKAHAVNSAVAKGLLSKIKPRKYHDCPVQRAKYTQWWAERADYCEVEYHKSVPSGRVKIGIVKTYNKVVDLFNTPVDPPTRKRQRDKLDSLRAQQSILDEQREQRKERKIKRKEQQAYKRKLKQAYGVAH